MIDLFAKIESLPAGVLVEVVDTPAVGAGSEEYIHTDELIQFKARFHRLAEIVEVAEKALKRYADEYNWSDDAEGSEGCVFVNSDARYTASKALDHIHKLKGGSDGK